MTAEIEFDDAGEPAPFVQLAGPEAGRGVQYRFRRSSRPGQEQPWVFVEISRRWLGEPAPGSSEALQRLLESEDWPGARPGSRAATSAEG